MHMYCNISNVKNHLMFASSSNLDLERTPDWCLILPFFI